MNVREKRLICAAAIVAAIGLLNFFLGGNEPPAEAQTPPPTSTRTVTANRPASWPSALVVSAAALEVLLERRIEPAALTLGDDPFKPLPALATAPVSGSGVDQSATVTIRLRGIYVSGNLRGAFIDGELYFVGDPVGAHVLTEVTTEGIRLARGDKEIFVPYEPRKFTSGSD